MYNVGTKWRGAHWLVNAARTAKLTWRSSAYDPERNFTRAATGPARGPKFLNVDAAPSVCSSLHEMPISSLAEQLARGASLNANLLNEKSRSQAASESYLFSPKEARQHDLDSLHALGLNGFLQLKSLQPDLAHFEQALFSDSSRHLDRTLQPAEQNASLDSTISAFLPTLGPFLLDAPTGKVLEWLVRRFR